MHAAKKVQPWLLALGEQAGFPDVEIRPGVGVRAGEDAWRTFSSRGTAEDGAAAATALKRLLAGELEPGLSTMLIADIVVGARFRRDLGDLEGLADSVRGEGLLQPIV